MTAFIIRIWRKGERATPAYVSREEHANRVDAGNALADAWNAHRAGPDHAGHLFDCDARRVIERIG